VEGEERVVEEGRRTRCSHSMEVVKGGGWQGTVMGERIGLLTAGGRFLFEISNCISELAIRRALWGLTWRLFAAVGFGVGASCTQTAFQAALE